MRKCPVCMHDLKEIKYHKETIDRCEQCGGAFFDEGELEAIIQIVGIFQTVDLKETEIDTIEQKEKIRELKCPDHGVLMEKREIAGETVDICPGCKGIWLDRGEIVALKMAEDHIRENMNLYIRLGN